MLTAQNLVLPILALAGCGQGTCRNRSDRQSGIYSTLFGDVYCEQRADGGGWLLAYSNANNWADPKAADIPVDLLGRSRFYDARWSLRKALDPNRLGDPWLFGPLLPEHVGALDIARVHAAGLSDVRVEFVSPSCDVSRTCSAAVFDWTLERDSSCVTEDGSITLQAGLPPIAGEIRLTIEQPLSEFASTPGYLASGQIDHMVSFWAHTSTHTIGEDYQVRIWLREPH